jgi:hypothetical protein
LLNAQLTSAGQVTISSSRRSCWDWVSDGIHGSGRLDHPKRVCDKRAGKSDQHPDLLVIHSLRSVAGGELGTAVMNHLISVREQFHSNMIGLHIDSGSWLTSERLAGIAHGLFPNSSGSEEAQARAALLLGGQVKVQAFALAYSDAYVATAFVAALAIILIAFMKPMKIIFDADSAGVKP